MIATRITTVADLRSWASGALDLDDTAAARVAREIWHRDDFPHPVNNTDMTDYLAELDEEWLYAMAEHGWLAPGEAPD